MINDKSILGASEVAVPTSLAGIFKVIRDIQIVSALPAIPDPTVTYLVGAQTTISITGLNGNADLAISTWLASDKEIVGLAARSARDSVSCLVSTTLQPSILE